MIWTLDIMVYIILRQLQFIMFTILLLITLQILNSFKEFLQYHVQAKPFNAVTGIL